MPHSPDTDASRLPAAYTKFARVYQHRCATAITDFAEATNRAAAAWLDAAKPLAPAELWCDAALYASDFAQRSLLFWDTFRRRGNNWLEHEKAGKPPLLAYEWEMVSDGRLLSRPVNYALVRIRPPAGVATGPDKRPLVIIDPRAGHGPGIGGFKQDSQVGVALKAGHPVYFVIFFPEPMKGQTLADVARAESGFLRLVRERHPTRGKPVVIGNCQGGWAAMLVGALDPDCVGPLVINGAPMSYWAGNDAENPMRYAGGMLGGTWPALLASDLGGGKFDGAYLVENFELLNPANTFFDKYYDLFARIDTEPERFLDFERWWGGFFLMNREEIKWIVENLFVGNKLAAGGAEWSKGQTIDLRAIRSPIVLFASLGDNITPPQQAFNWVADLYPTTEDLKASGQVIVGLMHDSIGHLGIFVSGAVAKREHAQIVDLLEYIEHLPPGLYGMRIEEEFMDGTARYDVTLTEQRVEDLQRLQKYARHDEIPFRAVAAVSEVNASAYETLAHPVLGALVPAEVGKLARALHPLRVQRWAVSDLNPWPATVAGLANLAAVNRTPRDEAGPSAAAERWVAATVSASWDLFRQVRDATVENVFFNTYGTLSVIAPAQPEAAVAAAPVGRHTPAISRVLTRMEEGGFTEAAVRAYLLVARLGNRERRLSTLKNVRELVGPEVGLLALPADDARAIIREQAFIVDYEPERAIQTLPALLRGAEDRGRLLDLIDRLAGTVALNPNQRGFVIQLRRILSSGRGDYGLNGDDRAWQPRPNGSTQPASPPIAP